MAFSVRSRKSAEKKQDDFIEESLSDDEQVKKGVAYKAPVWLETLNDRLRIGILTSFSYYLRTMKLGYPGYITEPELELARQVNWYMEGKFFIGKFPPLVGIVSSGLSRIVGYYGTEDLSYAGQRFEEFPLVALRRLSALLGASLIPLSYLTMRNMGHSRSTATMTAALITLENGLVTQSRFATPEIYVLFFSALATYSWTLMQKYNQESQSLFNPKSSIWQTVTGVSLGCALSCKWTGALTMPVIWGSILLETWNRLTDHRHSIKNTLQKLYVYALTVGFLPLLVYFTIFSFHLDLVPNAGDHDLLVSSKLKYSLNGNVLEPTQPNIAYGSQIVIRHDGTVGGYLHSHKKRFSGGSTQQQVTLYPHVDINNIWTVHKANILWNSSHPIEFVRNHDQIRLEHFASSRKLHSHDHRPQLTNKKEHSEVTAYGDKLINDSHDFWTIKILTEENVPSKDKQLTWKSLNQRFRLMHVRGCNLISFNSHYAPPEGENHQEVTCMSSAGTHVSPWTVESSYHEQLEKMITISYDKMSKKEMMKEVHSLMTKYPVVVYNRMLAKGANNGAFNLVNSEETPKKWFLKRTGLKIWGELSGFSSHLVLNPMVRILTLGSMLIYVGFLAMNAFLSKRQIKLPLYLLWLNSTGLDIINNYTGSIALFYSGVVIPLIGLRFVPAHTISMSDILGTMYYGTGLVSIIMEALTTRLAPMYRRSIIYGLLAITLVKFSHLSHLAYGGQLMYRSECEKSGFDIDCLRFPPSKKELLEIIETSGRTENATQLTIYLDLPGQSQPFRYNQGEEADADNNIAKLRQEAYIKETRTAKGPNRYHRVIPTPPISPAEAAQWAKDIYDSAFRRDQEAAQRRAEEERKRAEEAQKQVDESAQSVQQAIDKINVDPVLQEAVKEAQMERESNPNAVPVKEAIQQAAENLKPKKKKKNAKNKQKKKAKAKQEANSSRIAKR